MSSGPATAVVEEVDAKGTPQAPRIGGRQKKKVKASKPVLPKKQKKVADEKKHKWEESDSEEEVVVAPEPAPPQPQGKKKKKGKKAAAEPAPEEEAWVEIPKKVKKKKAAVADTSVEKGGKTVLDLGDKKSAVIGKGGSVIKGIQVRPRPACHPKYGSCAAHSMRVLRRALALTSILRKPAPPAPSAELPNRCAYE